MSHRQPDSSQFALTVCRLKTVLGNKRTGTDNDTDSPADHQNWFGIDENLGPLAVSIRRERVPATVEDSRLVGGHQLPSTSEHFMYRLIVRTSDLLPLRGTVLEDSIPALKSEKIKTIPTKDVLEFCFPELQLTR